MLKTISVLLLLLAAASLTGCGGSSPNESLVTGAVTYRQRIALPTEAVVTVSIEDVSLADAPGKVIGKQIIETKGSQVPIPFAVPYDSDKVEENHTYSLRARIEDANGKLLFTSDTSVLVITGANPTKDVEVFIIPIGN